jgi:uncharacterized protein (TIGR02466 family)
MKQYIRTDLFPSTIEASEIGRKLTKKEHTLLTNMPCHENFGNLTSENNYVLELPELAKLKADFMEAVQHYMDTIVCAKPDVKAYITQSWVNYTGQGQSHHKHWHKNSYLSGVFYVSAEESVDKIKFYNDESYSQLDFNPTEWNISNSKSWWYPAKTGRLIIFPSHLTHSVEQKQESNIRISLSFNTFLKGNLGDKFALTEVIL